MSSWNEARVFMMQWREVPFPVRSPRLLVPNDFSVIGLLGAPVYMDEVITPLSSL